MQLTLNNKANFCTKFLKPISCISDLVIINVENDRISSLNKTSDNNIILYTTCTDISSDTEQRTSLNIADIKKFIRAFDCIEDTQVNVKVNGNNIEYKSPKTKFKFHLLEDGIIAPIAMSIQKIERFNYDTKFKISAAAFASLLRSSTFITDSNCKIYIYTEGSAVHAELTDKTRHNVDSYSTLLSDSYEGNAINSAIPFPFESIRSISTLKSLDISVQINTSLGIMCIDVVDEGYSLKYISTAMAV